MKEILTLRIESEIKERLNMIAKMMDRSSSYIASKAIKEYIHLNEWQIQAIEMGIKQADRGELISHTDIKSKWEKKLGNKVD